MFPGCFPLFCSLPFPGYPGVDCQVASFFYFRRRTLPSPSCVSPPPPNGIKRSTFRHPSVVSIFHYSCDLLFPEPVPNWPLEVDLATGCRPLAWSFVFLDCLNPIRDSGPLVYTRFSAFPIFRAQAPLSGRFSLTVRRPVFPQTFLPFLRSGLRCPPLFVLFLQISDPATLRCVRLSPTFHVALFSDARPDDCRPPFPPASRGRPSLLPPVPLLC